MKSFNIKQKITSKGEAQSLAIEYQQWASEQDLSYGELVRYNHYFERLGRRFGLIKEFRENGII